MSVLTFGTTLYVVGHSGRYMADSYQYLANYQETLSSSERSELLHHVANVVSNWW